MFHLLKGGQSYSQAEGQPKISDYRDVHMGHGPVGTTMEFKQCMKVGPANAYTTTPSSSPDSAEKGP